MYMPRKNLEKVMKERVKPFVEGAMHRLMGVTIAEITNDITGKIESNPLLDFKVDTSMGFKKAKKRFKKQYLQKLLQTNLGNISEAAKIADINRRSIHRLVKESRIDVEKIREELARPYEIKKEAVNHIIENVLESYKDIIHPEKLEKMYKNVSDLSKGIVDELPTSTLTLKEAEEEFERQFIIKALSENEWNITKTALKIGLRYETIHRKIKSLGLM